MANILQKNKKDKEVRTKEGGRAESDRYPRKS